MSPEMGQGPEQKPEGQVPEEVTMIIDLVQDPEAKEAIEAYLHAALNYVNNIKENPNYTPHEARIWEQEVTQTVANLNAHKSKPGVNNAIMAVMKMEMGLK